MDIYGDCNGDLLFLEVYHGVVSIPKVGTLWVDRGCPVKHPVEILISHRSGVVYFHPRFDKEFGRPRKEFLYYYRPIRALTFDDKFW